MNTQQIMAMLHRKKPIQEEMNTNETNDQNTWRPLEPGELADVNDTECLTPDGAWVKAQGCHMYTREEVFAEYGPTQLRTRRPRPAPEPEWRPLEAGERADINDTECLTPDGEWVKATGCHGYTLEEWHKEYRVIPTLRTRRPRPSPTQESDDPELCGHGVPWVNHCKVCDMPPQDSAPAALARVRELEAAQPSAPQYLDRPDKPGEWWEWWDDKWRCVQVHTPTSWGPGIWLPATPPPPPSKEGQV